MKNGINKLMRINKLISNSGLTSRRKADDLVSQGRVRINGKVAKPGDIVDTETDHVIFNDREIVVNNKFSYYILNKPRKVISSSSDDRGRKTVVDILNKKERLYPIGRLDSDSTGLILLTDDGDLALKLTHPRYHLPKTYLVSVREKISEDTIKKFSSGMNLGGVKTLPARVRKINDSTMEITLYQGLKRQIREMCKSVGLSVILLHRISMGPIKLGGLKSGEYRALTNSEILSLKSL